MLDNSGERKLSDNDIDWESLKNVLSPGALLAMKEHFASSQTPESTVDTANDQSKTNSILKMATSNAVFSRQEYWEERFEEEESYDWLVKYSNVRDIIVPLLKHSDNILIVGCGNSSFSCDLYDDGFHNIVNIDYSKVLIDKMKAANSEARPHMQWLYMDMTDLTFDSASFDVVIDKAAMDALMVDEGDVWFPADSVIEATHKMCQCVQRVLKPNKGIFMQISFAQPHFRTKYLMGYHSESLNGHNNGEKGGVTHSPYECHTGYSNIYKWDTTFRSINIEDGCLNSYFYTMVTSDIDTA